MVTSPKHCHRMSTKVTIVCKLKTWKTFCVSQDTAIPLVVRKITFCMLSPLKMCRNTKTKHCVFLVSLCFSHLSDTNKDRISFKELDYLFLDIGPSEDVFINLALNKYFFIALILPIQWTNAYPVLCIR